MFLKERALLAPERLASDFAQIEFCYYSVLMFGEEEDIFLNHRCELREDHNLGKPGR